MNDYQSDLNKLYNKIAEIKEDNKDILTDENLAQLNILLDGTNLASKQDPNFFYNLLQDYKTESKRLLSEFYTELERDNGLDPGTIDINYDVDTLYGNTTKREILKLKYDILQNNIEILRTYIRSKREDLGDTINDMRNNEHFATTLNSDYSEIYKYKYLRNWGIFLSILGGAYFFKKMK